MFCTKGEFVVYSGGKRCQLVKVTGIDSGTVSGILEKGRPYKKEDVSFPAESIVANLGSKPHLGSAFSCLVEPFWKTVENEDWGPIHFFRRIKKSEYKILVQGLNEAFRWLDLQGLTSVLPIVIEVRPAKGKYAGTWKQTGKEDEPNIMTLKPKEFEDLYSTILHEMGHAVWGSILPDRYKAQWINMYRKLVMLQEVSAKKVNLIRDNFVKSALPIKEFRSTLDGEDQEIFDEGISYITSTHSINAEHINILIDQDEEVGEMWPKSSELVDMEETITEYALTSVEELFSEALMLHANGTKLPRAMLSLMTKSLRVCKNK